ncbi:MAG TPA: M28 family metallopeptidase [Flavobacteriaceae bacterium]|nr:M28 family metallopeptidase [Flavobacteriaceae bacterium]
MKNFFFFSFVLLFLNCGSNQINEAGSNESVAINYANTITASDLKTHLFTFASDEFEGRLTGEPGQKKAANYLRDFYISQNINSPLSNTYFQPISTENLRPHLKPSENVLAWIEGSSKPEEIIVITAHYDHLGMNNGEIYNGADDDGSGNVAILEIAQAFKKAKDEGNGPQRSILFLHVTGEENGLLGSKFYVENPVFDLNKTIANLNIDMIGRIDDEHLNNSDYIYIIGSNKLSSELHEVSEEANKNFTNIELDYTFNTDNDPNRYYYRSDHYNFAKNNIPVIFYFNGTHQDYHKPSDTPDKIEYDLLAKRTKLIFYTAWELANRENRIALD